MTRKSRTAIFLGVILAGALLLRAALARFVFASTRDTSVVGIMAVQILEGARPLFYAGQNYMGALEAYAVAAVFRVFGVSPGALALAPILFAVLWTGSVYALFRRLSGSVGGGLAAAACAAFGGWHTLWYTMGAYGGYPEMLLFGTLALVLVFDLAATPSPARWKWVALGMVLALGVWTNMQVMPFFLTAGVWLLADWWWRGRPWRRLAAMASMGAASLLGFAPMLVVRVLEGGGGETHMASPALRLVVPNMRVMWYRTLPDLLWWPETEALWVRVLVLGCVLVAFVAYAAVGWRNRRGAWALPAIFAVFFFALFLTHPMAGASAPRYLIAVFTMVLGAGFAALVASPRRAARCAGWALLVLWCGYNATEAVSKCVLSAPLKTRTLEERRQIVAAARQAGLQHVKLFGGLGDQLRGLMLSMTREREVRFLAFQDERILEHQEGWERDAAGGYAFAPGLLPYFTGALAAMGVDNYTLTPAPGLLLLGDMTPPSARLRQTAIRHLAVEGLSGEAAWLTDGVRATGIGPGSAAVQRLVIALEGVKRVGGMRFFPVDHELPRGPYTIERSLDGVDYIPVVTTSIRSGESYISGNRIYFKDYDPAQDHRWPPFEAAFLRVTVDSAGHSAWHISEIMVFEYLADGEPVPDQEVEQIAAALEAAGVSFAFADRWLSSRLERRRLAAGNGPRTLPPMNIRYPATMRPRAAFARRDQAVAVAIEMADEAEQRLRQSLPDAATVIARDFGHYRLLRIEGAEAAQPDPPLYWNGHTLLEVHSPSACRHFTVPPGRPGVGHQIPPQRLDIGTAWRLFPKETTASPSYSTTPAANAFGDASCNLCKPLKSSVVTVDPAFTSTPASLPPQFLIDEGLQQPSEKGAIRPQRFGIQPQ